MQPRRWIRENVDFTRYVHTRKGPYAIHYKPGYWTDDTEHTLAVIDALSTDRLVRFALSLPLLLKPCSASETLLAMAHALSARVTMGGLVELFSEHYAETRNWLGIGRQGHGSIEEYYLSDSPAQTLHNTRTRRMNQCVGRVGNAPVMRCLPFAFAKSEEDLRAYSLINSEVTHPHTDARLASTTVAFAARFLILERGGTSHLIKYCISTLDDQEPEYARFKAHFQELDKAVPTDPFNSDNNEYGIRCDCLETTCAILFILKWYQDPWKAFKAAIRFGGDVDTLASTVFAITMAQQPHIDKIPTWLLSRLENPAKLLTYAQKLRAFYETGFL